MLESSLVLLTVLSMVLFIFDMGRLLVMEQVITERVRTTARKAAVNSWTGDQIKNYLVYNSVTAPSGNSANAPGLLGLTPSQVSYSTQGTSGQSDYRVVVSVQNVPALTMIPVMNNTYTLPTISIALSAQSMGATN